MSNIHCEVAYHQVKVNYEDPMGVKYASILVIEIWMIDIWVLVHTTFKVYLLEKHNPQTYKYELP